MKKTPVRLGKKPEPKPLPDINWKFILGILAFIVIFIVIIYIAYASRSFYWYNYKL